MHRVKCLYCEKYFDTDKEESKKVSERRWAHLKCYEHYQENRLKEEENLNVLKDYINTIYKNVNIDWKTIMSQIKTLMKNGCTYSGIQKTLIYCYEIKKMDVLKANGAIGIVFSKYNEARDYYKKMYIDNKKALSTYEVENVIKEISLPTKEKKIKLLDLNLGED